MIRAFFLALVLALASAGAQSADLQSFGRGSWSKLRAAHDGQPIVVHFWGLTCAPCLVEMPEWGKLRAERPDMRLVMVAADPVPQDPARVSDMLARANLAKAENWAFADRFNERLRYEIDPNEFKHFDTWRQRMAARPAVVRALAIKKPEPAVDLASDKEAQKVLFNQR